MNAAGYAFLAQDLAKSFSTATHTSKALDSVSVGVRPGGMTALVGPDGAGKTTFLRIAAGLLLPDSGKLLLNDIPLADQGTKLQKIVGYMPQRFGLYEDLTVQENLDFYADLYGLDALLREERYQELLHMSGMAPFRERLAGKLSGGMKQKLGLICTLIRTPTLLLLDEPTVGVDPLSRRELMEMVITLVRQLSISVILSTSYMEEAEQCDSIILLHEGKVLAQGTPEELRSLSNGMSHVASIAAGNTPRTVQARLLDLPEVIDAVPQGNKVRLLFPPLQTEQEKALVSILAGPIPEKILPSSTQQKPTANLPKSPKLSPAPSRLEDSFILLLHRQKAMGQPSSLFPHGEVTSPPSQPDLPKAEYVPQKNTDEIIIQTKNVSRFFGDFIAVNNVSFSVAKGEVFGLLGPNGAGKTTTFRMLCGLLPASEGELFVAGVNVRDAREEARRHIGYVAQKFSLYGPLSVEENLKFFAGAYRLRGKAQKHRMEAVIHEFSLQSHLRTPAASLPGGYKQRLAMAIGLLHEPAILFLDEPTSGADPLARREFWKRISKLAERGVTVVVTTHFMEEAEYCDRILIQDNGMMLALGTPDEIRQQTGGLSTMDMTMEEAFISIVLQARQNKKGTA